MACRCATILPAGCGTAEYAVDGVNTVLVEPTDVEIILAAVHRYLESEEFYCSIVEHGMKAAAGYSVDDACRSELEFFSSVTNLSVASLQNPVEEPQQKLEEPALTNTLFLPS